ncbi:FMN-binding negative transcriptional regulator [Kordiimonas sp.]|uniref:FMN-binding negative transcriptional regulator n=1 Tax=Kordiimonas sp. TaxID=1970157 RepID=UPI003B51F0F4
MSYPSIPHREEDWSRITGLIKAYPFAHLFTGSGTRARVTRLPFAFDDTGEGGGSLRAHMDARNPQVSALDDTDVLVAFSGPDAYVSPNWRNDRSRGATWDYTAVHIWGRAVIRRDRDFFATLIRDLAAPAEEKYQSLSDAPTWTFEDAPEDYVNRLLPHLVGFEITITRVEAISKLHQDFAPKDALRVADHLAQSPNEDGRTIASLIRAKTALKQAKRTS